MKQRLEFWTFFYFSFSLAAARELKILAQVDLSYFEYEIMIFVFCLVFMLLGLVISFLLNRRKKRFLDTLGAKEYDTGYFMIVGILGVASDPGNVTFALSIIIGVIIGASLAQRKKNKK